MTDVKVRNNNEQSSDLSRTHSPIDSLFRNLERDFNRLLGKNWPYIGKRTGTLTNTNNVDIVDRGESYELRMDMPGVSSEDVNVSIRNNVLEVRAERQDELEEEGDEYVTYTQKKKSHSFSLNLGKDNIEVDDIQASLDNGILRVNLPKDESQEVHKEIEVE